MKNENCSDINILCKYIGGSHLYGLNTPESDEDIRGVFISTNPLVLTGYIPEPTIVHQNKDNDISLKGFNDFVRLLAKGNTEAMECLYNNPHRSLELDDKFKKWILNNPRRFLNSIKIFHCFRGYMQGERKLANGERTGLLGGKRKIALETYGFSPRNFSHLIRLAFCGTYFFKYKTYPVHIVDFDINVARLCLEIKTEPEKFTKEQLNELVDTYEHNFVDAYENREFDLEPDLDYVRDVLCIMNRQNAQTIIQIALNNL